MNWEKFKSTNTLFFDRRDGRQRIIVDDRLITYCFDENNFELSQDEFETIINDKYSFNIDECRLEGKNYYEVLIQSPNGTDPWLRRGFEIVDDENEVSYILGQPSMQLWGEISSELVKDMKRNRRTLFRMRPNVFNREGVDLSIKSILWNGRFFSLTIKSKKEMKIERFEELDNSIMFNISYNMSMGYKHTNLLNEYSRSAIRKNYLLHPLEENEMYIETPKRIYKRELTGQYLMGLGSGDPFTKFICLYHIIEHFFDQVYKEDIIEKVRKEITAPGFSPKRNKDVTKVVNLIQNKVKKNNTEFCFNELEALELVLKKFIQLDDLKDEIVAYSSDLLIYYRDNQVVFSSGDTIDLSDSKNEKQFTKMAARIYKTRNSIVHSKSNDFQLKERCIYIPFKDDVVLEKEIPLMQLIAEKIILETSTLL